MSPERSAEREGYVSTQLIPYLGSKRSLLPRLKAVFGKLLDGLGPEPRFLDPFCGTGSVSRLARSLGMRVAANDLEPYAALLTRVWIALDPEALRRSFEACGGVHARFERLNALHPERGGPGLQDAASGYFARYYAPRSTANPDWRRERLFFSAENAAFMDRVLAALRSDSTLDKPEPELACSPRDILLASLLLETATHANTSGVFKAFHKGFGGHSGDALTRILGAMRLEVPILIEGPPAEVAQGDAVTFVRGRPVDLAYLDPPYNQHQYGSNYHVLNTILKPDPEPPGLELSAEGELLSKAGIPPSWRDTRSAFCSRASASLAYAALLDGIDARRIVVSANTEGTVGFEELCELLGARGRLDVRVEDYVRYRGGRQSAQRLVRNHEIILVVDARDARGKGVPSGSELKRLSLELALRRALSRPLDPRAVAERFEVRGDILVARSILPELLLPLELGVVPNARIESDGLDDKSLERLVADLDACSIRDNGALVAAYASAMADPRRQAAAARKALACGLRALRRLAHEKHRAAFEVGSQALRQACGSRGEALRARADIELERLGLLLARRTEARSSRSRTRGAALAGC